MVALVAISALAIACSGGGSSVSAAIIPTADQGPTGVDPTGASTGPTALPGLVGYDLPEGPASALAGEPNDVPWSEATDAVILAGLSDLIIAPDTLIAIECRTTFCGVVVDGPDTSESNLHWTITDRLQELFAF